jgi:hypothetical protein
VVPNRVIGSALWAASAASGPGRARSARAARAGDGPSELAIACRRRSSITDRHASADDARTGSSLTARRRGGGGRRALERARDRLGIEAQCRGLRARSALVANVRCRVGPTTAPPIERFSAAAARLPCCRLHDGSFTVDVDARTPQSRRGRRCALDGRGVPCKALQRRVRLARRATSCTRRTARLLPARAHARREHGRAHARC